MATVHEIKKTIQEKIKQSLGVDFILEEDFDRQLSAIKTNLLTAIEEAKKILGDNILETYYATFSYSWGHYTGMAEKGRNINDTVLKFYHRTNSRLENRDWNEGDSRKEFSPLNFYQSDKIKSAEKHEYGNFRELIRFAEKCLKGEDLSETIRYFINITSWESMIIYLISKNRITKLEIEKRAYGDICCSSNEHIIQKDIKKVEVYNQRIYFHYHGLHDPDILIMDNYEAAVNLRKEISELREKRFSFGTKKGNRKR